MDQIEIRIPKTIVEEGSGFTATADFRTRATDAASAPTNVYYRVDCLTTKQELADWTNLSAASEVSIPVTPTHNAIQSAANDYEIKQLTVMADRNLSTQQVAAKFWRVDNLFGSP